MDQTGGTDDDEPSYPGPATFYRSGRKFGWLLVISACIAATALGSALNDNDVISRWLAWVVAALFGFATTVCSLALVMRGWDCLTLGPTEFEVVAMFGRRSRYRWQDVSSFCVKSLKDLSGNVHLPMVFFDDATKKGALEALSLRLTGHNSSLPDTYGYDAGSLARYMNRWRVQALAAQSGPST